MAASISPPGPSTSHAPLIEYLPIIVSNELEKKQLPDYWSPAKKANTEISWELGAYVHRTVPIDWLSLPFDQWPRTFPKTWLLPLKDKLEELYRDIPLDAMSQRVLHLLWCYGVHHFQTLFDQLDLESQEWLKRREPISKSLLIRKNLERYPDLDSCNLFALLEAALPFTNYPKNFNQDVLFYEIEWYQNLLSAPSTKTIQPFIKIGDKLKIFLCQLYLPQIPQKERKSALNEMLYMIASPKNKKDKNTHFFQFKEYLHFLNIQFMAEFLTTYSIESAKYRASLREPTSQALPSELFVEFGDLVYGFNCLVNYPSEFHSGFKYIYYYKPLTSHKEAQQTIINYVFQGEDSDPFQTTAWNIYKTWWYAPEQRPNSCLIERLIHWHAHELLVDSGLWYLSLFEFEQIMQATFQKEHPLLPYYPSMAKISYRKLHQAHDAVIGRNSKKSR